MDLLNGTIWDKALRFAVPLALTGMLQQLFNAADIAVVGRFVGANAMAAVGSNAPVVGLLVNLFVGISIGANVVIARYTGQRNAKKTSEATHTAFLLALICGLIVAVVGSICSGPMIRMMGVPEEVADYSMLYLRIYFIGVPFIILYNFESAIFRSQGNTKTPLISLTIGGVLNVAANLFFVLKLHMTVDGVACATVLANAVSSSMLFVFLRREKSDIRLDMKKMHINGRILKQMLAIGVPSGLQSMVFSISNICIQSAINSLGAAVMAASSAAFNIEIFAYYVTNSFGQACVTFIGQNYGAGNYQRCRKITKQLTLLNIGFAVAFSIVIIIGARFFLSLFNQDPEIIEIGLIRVRLLMCAQAVSAVLETLSGTLRGLGKSLEPAIITFVGICGTRIAWVYSVFLISHNFMTLMAIYPLSWVFAAVILVIVYWKVSRKLYSQHISGE
ncbi:MAG: MATE family efflux transporter [Clostridiales bacterium]|nr:MATE family efflux transporter [Candidatus Crickella merdequi]